MKTRILDKPCLPCRVTGRLSRRRVMNHSHLRSATIVAAIGVLALGGVSLAAVSFVGRGTVEFDSIKTKGIKTTGSVVNPTKNKPVSIKDDVTVSGTLFAKDLRVSGSSPFIRDVACQSGQVLKKTATGWACAADALATASCVSGQVLKRSTSGWACGDDQDSDTFAPFDILAPVYPGRVLKATSSGWTLGYDNDTDTDTFAALTCPTGGVPKRTTSGWTCVVPTLDSLPASLAAPCFPGDALVWFGSSLGWRCSSAFGDIRDFASCVSQALADNTISRSEWDSCTTLYLSGAGFP